MKLHRSLLVLGAVSALYAVSSCSGEDGKKKQLPDPDAGAQAGNGGASSGGSSSGGKAGTGGGGGEPRAGAAGDAPGGASGEAGMGGMGGMASGGEAGAGGASCGTPADESLSCATIVADLNPRFDAATGEFRFDVSSLGVEIVSGFATYFEWTIEDEPIRVVQVGCATLDGAAIQVQGSDVVISTGGAASGETVTLTYLMLRDACGNEYSFVPPATACSMIEFMPADDASTLWSVGCSFDYVCDSQCA